MPACLPPVVLEYGLDERVMAVVDVLEPGAAVRERHVNIILGPDDGPRDVGPTVGDGRHPVSPGQSLCCVILYSFCLREADVFVEGGRVAATAAANREEDVLVALLHDALAFLDLDVVIEANPWFRTGRSGRRAIVGRPEQKLAMENSLLPVGLPDELDNVVWLLIFGSRNGKV